MPHQRQSTTEQRLDRLYSEAERWVVLWGLSRLLRDISIEFADDLGPALGRLDLGKMQIRLNGVLLLPANESLLHETLCHELAHAVAAYRYGPGIKEHGIEWCEYMEKAGSTPRPVIHLAEIEGLDPTTA